MAAAELPCFPRWPPEQARPWLARPRRAIGQAGVPARVGYASAAFGAQSDVTSPATFVQDLLRRPGPAQEPPMPIPQRQGAVITLGVGDLARSRRFYGEGFGWEPTFANDEIVFYQMNGCVLATWLATLRPM